MGILYWQSALCSGPNGAVVARHRASVSDMRRREWASPIIYVWNSWAGFPGEEINRQAEQRRKACRIKRLVMQTPASRR